MGDSTYTQLVDANGIALGSSALVSNVEIQGYGTSTYAWTSNGAGVVPTWQAVSSPAAAAQSDQETSTSTTTYVSPGRQQFHPSAAKAWVNANINGTSDVSFNISSITDVATGKIGINFTTAFSTADYSAICTPQNTTTSATAFQDTSNLAAGRSDFWCIIAGTPSDPVEWNMAFWGDQ